MAFCLAHTAAGYVAYEAVRPAERHRPMLLLGAVALANAPDVDYLPGLVIGHPGAFHRGITHTLAAAVVVAIAAWLLRRLRDPRWSARAALWVGATYASHLVVDYFTPDTKGPGGGQFLWPLSSSYWISPVTPLREIVVDTSGRAAFFQSLVGPQTRGVWIEETSILLAVVLVVHLLRALVATESPAVPGVAEDA